MERGLEPMLAERRPMEVNMKEGEGIRTAVDVLVVDLQQRKFLLGKRTSKVGKDLWGFPGGHQKTGELLINTARRELTEELGDEVKIDLTERIVAVRENRLPPYYIPHVTVIVFGWYKGGELLLPENEKNSNWQWFDIYDEKNWPKELFSKADEVVRNFRQGKQTVVSDFPPRESEL